MADFTKNITNSVNVFGEGPSTKWGQASFPATMIWGTSKWGEGRAMQFQVVKYATSSLSPTWDRSAAQVGKNFEIGSSVVTMDMGSETMKQGDWKYIFTSNQTEAENRNLSTWTEVANNDVTFTCQAAGATSWSEV